MLGRVITALLFIALVVANLDAIVVQWTTGAPPPGSEPDTDQCWTRDHRGQHVLYLAGDAFTLGYCNSKLLRDVMARQEDTLQHALDTFLPFGPLQHTMLRVLAWVYRDFPDHLTASEKLEIAGLAAGYDDPYPQKGPTYSRLVYYHAIHDISQAMVDNPLLACSAFAATGQATVGGHALLGRLFDFEGGRVFDEDKVVVFYKPDYGLGFVSVVWAGMIGAVSGMNEAGLAITLNAATSDVGSTTGVPTTVLLRRVLQYARSIDEAVAVIERADVFVSDIFTVADGNTGEVAVIELTPGAVHVRRDASVVVATNHLLHDAFGGDEENAYRMEESTTVSRHARLSEVVQAARGALDPARVLSILRDRRLPGGADPGPGHRGSVDAVIAAHAVIFDATSRRLWVSRAPHALGEFIEYDLTEALSGRLRDHGALPADPMLTDGRFERLQRARGLLEQGGLQNIREAAALQPGYPPAQRALAEACDEAEEIECARAAYARFLALEPPHRKHRVEAEARLSELGGAP